jgi:hypothetical protein
MDAPTVALIVGVLSAAITSLGWIVLHFFTRKREIDAREFIAKREEEGREAARAQADRTRRLELRLNYYERQIQEFYAPIYSNLQLIWNVWSIGNRFEKELLETDNAESLEEVQKKIGRTLGVKYYAPLHAAIREILKSKLFLMEGVDLPQSYTDFLTHSVMEGIQRTLKEKDGINTSSVKGFPYPEPFNSAVKAGLEKAMRSYDEIIQELAASAVVLRTAPVTTADPSVASPARSSELTPQRA